MATKNKKVPFAVRLPEALLPILETKAKALGVPVSDLVRGWIIEKLEDESTALRREVRELAGIVIAALSESIQIDQAREIIASYLDGTNS